MADEYIRLDTTIIAINNLINEAATGTMTRTLFKAKDTIYNQQRYFIDVQPVDRWISVNEALPIYDGLVLICYNDKRIRLGVYTEDGWDSDEGNPIMEQPDFWVRIPEPPKQ